GIVGRNDGAPTSELAAKYSLAAVDRRDSRELKEKELAARIARVAVDAQTSQNIVNVLDTAVNKTFAPLITDVASAKLGLRPGAPAQPAAPNPNAPPPTPAELREQIAKVSALEQQVVAAKAKMQADLAQAERNQQEDPMMRATAARFVAGQPTPPATPEPTPVPTSGGPAMGTIFLGRRKMPIDW